MESSRVLELLRQSEALLEGHFELSSGNHSDRYFQCARALQFPAVAHELAASLGERLRAGGAEPFDLVVGPALGAVVWAFAVADALELPGLFTERVEGTMALRRGFRIDPGARILVVEDVLTTGGSAREVIELLRGLGAEPRAVGAIVNRTAGNPFEDLGLPLFALADVEARHWPADRCPLCADGGRAVKPGSRPGAAAEV